MRSCVVKMTEVANERLGSVSSQGLFLGRSRQTLDPGFPLYHGVIDCQTAMDRLGTVSSPGAFLVRNTGWRWDHVITYLDQTLDIKHIMISFRKSTDLKKHNPHITNLQTAVEVMVSLDPKRFAHEVHWMKFDTFKVQRFESDLKNVCHVCEKDYQSIVNHLTAHRVAYCKNCLGLIDARQITTHKISCEKRPSVYTCHVCDFGTRWKYHLNRHTEKLHGKQTFQCKYCKKYFGRYNLLEKHLHIHEGYKCSSCGNHFNSKGGRTYHEKANHVEDDKDTETFLKTYNASSVKNTKIVTDSEHIKEDPITQPKARESSNVSSSVKAKDYISSSSKRKFLQCQFCDYQGDSKKIFKHHVEKVHLSARTLVVLQCEFCADFSTKYKKNLLYHQEKSCPSLSEESHVVWFDD